MLILRKKTWIVVFIVGLSLVAGGVVWAAGSGFTDTTISDFNLGNVSTGPCLVSPSATNASGDGEVVLGLGSGGMLETFPGPALPGTWSSGIYGGSGSLTVSNGLTVDGYWAASNITVTLPRVLDFVATFGSSTQHIGLGSSQDLNASPSWWALFSTRSLGDQLYAWTYDNGTQTSTPLTATLDVPHRFRIEWTATQVDYYIDGLPVATHTSPTIDNMYPVVSDPVVGTPLVIDWMRMGDYVSNCTFESRPIDSGVPGARWGRLSATTALPTGATMTFNTRTSVTGTLWSGWTALNADTTIASPDNQWIQYQAMLTTTVSQSTPILASVLITGTTPTAVTALTFSGHAKPAMDPLPFVVIAVGVMLTAIVIKTRPRSRIS